MENGVWVKKSFGYILRRILAFILDALILFPIYGVYILILFTTPVPESERLMSMILAAVSLLAIVTLSLMYFVYLEYRYGKTVGKWIFKLKVETSVGGRSFLQITVRNALLPIDMIVGLLFIIIDKKSRRVGDIAADTLVVSV